MRTPDGQPIPHFAIQFFSFGYDPLTPSSLTKRVESPVGEFELQWSDAGPVDVVATATGFTPATLPQVALAPSRDEATPWEIVLVPEARIRGAVMNEQGQSVAGARVELEIYLQDISVQGEQDGVEDQAELEAYLAESNPNPWRMTDAQGQFELTGLPQGFYALSASHQDYYTASTEVTLEPGRVLEGIKLVLSKQGGILVIHVIDAQEKPVAGRAVSLEETSFHGVTDRQGFWRAENLPPGTYRIILSGEQANSSVNRSAARWTDVAVSSGKEAQVTFQLGPEIFVTGEVTRAGQPVVGIDVAVGQMMGSSSYASASVRTDAHGRFELPGLPPGEYQMTIAQGDDLAKLRFTLAPTDEHRSFRISLGDATAQGIVRDGATGKPIAEASVSLAPVQLLGDERADDDVFIAAFERQVQTDSSGRYQMSGIAPGEYSLDASAAGYGSLTSQSVNVTGPIFHHEIMLWTRGQLIVTVTNAQRLPLPRARVTVTSLAHPDVVLAGMTDHDGFVQWTDLAPDTYEVVVDEGREGSPADRSVVQITSGAIQRLAIIRR